MTPRATVAGGWTITRQAGPAAALHDRAVPDPAARLVWVFAPTRRALVLGSTQPDSLVDRAAAAALGADVVRRWSGGGAVWLEPGEVAWVDVVVPSDDPLSDDDVGRAALWLGRVWQAALSELGSTGSIVHDGPLACGPLGRKVCFGALASGEVTLTDGRKVVGVSQRRTRAGARFQCAVYTRWDPAPLVRLLRLGDDGAAALAEAATGTGRTPEEMADALVRHLPP